ncbi:MAG: MFS transporter, partial [Isosphaeraceae bacterium]
MTAERGERSAAWRWWVCVLLLLATMLNYMDRQALSQSATDVSGELGLSNEDYGELEQGFGLAFAAGGLVLGFVADRVSLRWLYPAVLLSWSAAGLATGWARDFDDLMACRVALGFFEAGQWPCALTASQRLLSRRDRALGNSVLQSGAAIGAVMTPLVVQALVSDRPGSWRAPFQVIGLMGIGWAIAWLAMIRAG